MLPTTWWPWNDVGHTDEARKETNELLPGVGRGFETPKPIRLLKRIIELGTNRDQPLQADIVMDFFAGTCSMAQATLSANREDNGNRRFIVVQIPELIYEQRLKDGTVIKTIADIGKERLRRAIVKLQNASNGQQDIFKNNEAFEDLGFRVFKLSESNYRQWRGVEERDGEKFAEEMELFSDPLLPGWKPEDVLWEVALKEGYSLSAAVEEVHVQDANRVWRVADPDKAQSFLICLDREIKTEAMNALQLRKEDLFVCRDAALTDEQAANLALTCKLKTI